MQKLHLVGFTTDLDGLILSARKGSRSGSFVVALDDALVDAMVDAVRRRDEEAEDGTGSDVAARLARAVGPGRTRPDSALSVREMQERLRAGASIDDVAADAGVDPEWVARFAPPVQAEQARIVDRARQMTFDKPRAGQSRLPLGDAVARNVLSKGVHLSDDDFESGWSANILPGGLWAIRFSYVSRGREQEAIWVLDPEEDDLSAGNRLASQLGYAASARARKAPGTRKKRASARKGGTKRPAAKKAGGRRRTAKKAGGRKAAPKKAAAKKAAPKKAAAKKAASKKAAPKKAAAKKAAAKKAAAKKAAAKRSAGRKAAPRRTARARAPRKSSGDRAAGGRGAPPVPSPASRLVAVPAPRPAPAPSAPGPAPERPTPPPPLEQRPAAPPARPTSRLVPVPPPVQARPAPPQPAPEPSPVPPPVQARPAPPQPAPEPSPSPPPRPIPTPPTARRPAPPVIRADRAAATRSAVEGDGSAPPPVPPRRLRRRREPLRAR